MERFSALIGFFLILGIAFLLSNNRRAIRWKTVGWGLFLQVATAILVLKGELIASYLTGLQLGMNRNIAAAIVIVLLIAGALVAGRLSPGARRAFWIVVGVVTLFFFLVFNLLAFMFETLKDIVTDLIGFTAKGAAFVFGKICAGNGAVFTHFSHPGQAYFLRTCCNTWIFGGT